MADRPDGRRERPAVRTSIKLASAMIAVFCIFNAVDAYTTEVGLSKGAREINGISAFFIASLGVEGYVIAKVIVSTSFALLSIVVWRSWHEMNELVFGFYFALSVALLVEAVTVVLNNLIALRSLSLESLLLSLGPALLLSGLISRVSALWLTSSENSGWNRSGSLRTSSNSSAWHG